MLKIDLQKLKQNHYFKIMTKRQLSKSLKISVGRITQLMKSLALKNPEDFTTEEKSANVIRIVFTVVGCAKIAARNVRKGAPKRGN